MQTATDLDKIQADIKNATQITRDPLEINPQNTYTKIKMTLGRENNAKKADTVLQEHPKQKRRRKKRLQDARKRRNRHRKAKNTIQERETKAK